MTCSMGLFEWDRLAVGDKVALVMSMVCFDEGEPQKHMAVTLDRRNIKLTVTGNVPRGDVISGIDLVVTAVHPLQLAVSKESVVVQVPVCHFGD